MKKNFIFGCATLAQRLFYNLKKAGYITTAFVADDNYCDRDKFCEIPLVPYSKIQKLLPATEYEAYIAIGYSGMNAGRKEVMERLLTLGYSLPNYINHSVICDGVTMGRGNLIFAGSILDINTQIGNGNILDQGVLISHDNQIGNYNFFAPRATLAGNISVGNQNFFGLNCSVKNGVKIADRCLIGASAYAKKNLKDGSVMTSPKGKMIQIDSTDMIRFVMN